MERSEMNYSDFESDRSFSPSFPKKQKKQKSYRKKVEKEWSHETTLKLIEEIETRRSLWDVRCAEYKMAKESLWQEVADAVNMSINECKGKWSNLRTTFNSNLDKHKKKKSGQAENESVSTSWKFFKQMMFLEANKVLQSTQSTLSLQLVKMEPSEINYCDFENDGSFSQSPTQSSQKKQRKQKSYRKKVEREWSHETIFKLIQEIETRRSLWDVGCVEYKMPKETLWQEVGHAVNMPINECKGKWSNLRTTFNSNLNKHRNIKSGHAANDSVSISWKFFKQMMFLESNKVLQSTQPNSSLQLNSAVDDHSFLRSLGEGNISSLSTTEKRLRCNVSVSTPSTSSADTSQSANLKQMAVKAVQSIYSQPKNASTALCDYMALELENLTPVQGACARAQLRRAFNDIMDKYSVMPLSQEDLPQKLLLQECWDSNELSFVSRPAEFNIENSTNLKTVSDHDSPDEVEEKHNL